MASKDFKSYASGDSNLDSKGEGEYVGVDKNGDPL